MDYFEEHEQAILDDVHRQFMEMLKVVPEDRRDGLQVYVHVDKSAILWRVCINFSGSYMELENGKSKAHYFETSTNIYEVEKMFKTRGYKVERDHVGWLKVKVA